VALAAVMAVGVQRQMPGEPKEPRPPGLQQPVRAVTDKRCVVRPRARAGWNTCCKDLVGPWPGRRVLAAVSHALHRQRDDRVSHGRATPTSA
jgi:hypothetical protein